MVYREQKTNIINFYIIKSKGSLYNKVLDFFMALSTLFIGGDILSFSIFNINIRLCQFFLIISALLMICKHKFKIKNNISLLIFLFSSLISTVLAFNVLRSTLFYFSILFNVVFLLFLYSSYVKEFGINKIIKIFRITSYIQFFLMVMQTILYVFFDFEFSFLPSYGWFLGVPRFSLWFYEPSYFMTYLMIWFSLSSYMLLIKSDKTYIKDFLCCIIMTILSTSTTGFVGVAVVLAVVYFLWLKKGIRPIKIVFLLMIIASVFIVFKLFPTMTNLFIMRLFNSSLDEASGGRISAMFVGISVWEEFPLFGVGPGCYGLYVANSTDVVPSNLTIDLLATIGIFGLIAFTLFHLSLIYKALKVYKTSKNSYIPPLIIALIAFIFLLQMNQGYLRLYHWMLLGIIDGITSSASKQSRINDILKREVNNFSKYNYI